MKDLVVINKDNQLTTTSRKVAEVFGKQHDDVLKSIKKIECSDKFRLGNFAASSYINKQNKAQPMYELTRDGLTFLCMGYTGKKAAKFKEVYIAEFNRMEQHIKDQQQAKPMNELEILISVAQKLNDTNKKQAELEERLHKVECKQITSEVDEYSIKGYASMKSLNVDVKTASRLGRIASAMCRDRGIEIGKTKDTRYGHVNVYHEAILDEVFNLYFDKKERNVNINLQLTV